MEVKKLWRMVLGGGDHGGAFDAIQPEGLLGAVQVADPLEKNVAVTGEEMCGCHPPGRARRVLQLDSARYGTPGRKPGNQSATIDDGYPEKGSGHAGPRGIVSPENSEGTARGLVFDRF